MALQDVSSRGPVGEAVDLSGLNTEHWLDLIKQMVKIRAFEERVEQLYKSGKMPGLAHLYIGEEAVAVGVCAALRRDDYITSAAELLEPEGISAEVVDPRTLVPLNKETIVASARKTSRAIVIDEGYERFGVTAEIMSVIVDGAFADLDAPVKRMGAMDVPIPFSPLLEDLTVPTPEGVVTLAKSLCGR